MDSTASIVLAAGKGTRMKSDLVKVMHPLAGEPLISYPVTAALAANASRVVVVVGHQAEAVRAYFSGREDMAFALQEEQKGTGHAVACAAPLLRGLRGRVLILCGDVPLIGADTLRGLLAVHGESAAAVTVLTAVVDKPFGYGRIVKDEAGRVTGIVEERDATPVQRMVREINSGIYCVDAPFLFEAVAGLSSDNAQGEYYLTDIVRMAVERGLSCAAFSVENPVDVMGINDRIQLAEAESILRKRINEAHMREGVSIRDPAATYIDRGVTIGRDTVVHPNSHISGGAVIGEGCVIEPSVVIRGCRIGAGVVVKAGSVLEDSIIHAGVSIGPMAHIRPGTELKERVIIGNFVETKNTVMGTGSMASHLSYLGDAAIGRDVNIGCGAVTCNFDGVEKQRTVIEDGAFVGSGVQLIAPVRVGRHSLVAAGGAINHDVPPGSLAIARCRQVNKEGWRDKKTSEK